MQFNRVLHRCLPAVISISFGDNDAVTKDKLEGLIFIYTPESRAPIFSNYQKQQRNVRKIFDKEEGIKGGTRRLNVAITKVTAGEVAAKTEVGSRV